MVTPVDRIALLRAQQTAFTGIDFVHIVDPCDQTVLRVFFLTDLGVLTPSFSGANQLLASKIVIESVIDPNLPPIVVTSITESGGSQVFFDDDLQRHYIELTVAEPGNFTQYRLRIVDPLANPDPTLTPFSRIDPFFNDVEFSFKVACETDADCLEVEAPCPPEASPDFAVDYLARDFVSLRNALIDFAAQRYPQWAFPIEADVGMMLAEVFAALGDEFSYVQDRYAREAFLQTADQRRSLRKKARLLDFEIHDGRNPSTLLEVVANGNPGELLLLPAGVSVWSAGQSPVPFEVGLGLHDSNVYPVMADWNAGELVPFVFDEQEICLDVGATELFVEGEVAEKDLVEGRQILLRTEPVAGIVPRRHIVIVEDIELLVDPLQSEIVVSRIRWRAEDALPFQIDQTTLQIALNIVPATAGETLEAEFVTHALPATPFGTAQAVEREGPLRLGTTERSTVFLFGLERTNSEGLGFLGQALRATIPEVRVELLGASVEAWTYRRSLVGASPDDEVFTLEDGLFGRMRSFRTATGEFVHQDYTDSRGFSLRFGDGEFGRTPVPGAVFRVTYRTGPGKAANVPSGAITALEIPGKPREAPAFVVSVNNPLAVTDGVDPETQTEIKLLAPEAYQAELFFAVRPEDYGEQAERLDFVQRAQGSQRYTGSWLTTFVSGDVLGSNSLTTEQRDELAAWMDCVRQAGKEVNVQEPEPLALDLQITLCLEAFADPSKTLAQVQEVLLGSGLTRGAKGFFHPDNFTFGTPLRRTPLEAAILGVPGVRAVRSILMRLRGVRAFTPFTATAQEVGPNQILRLDNDPLHPENGTLTLLMEGSR